MSGFFYEMRILTYFDHKLSVVSVMKRGIALNAFGVSFSKNRDMTYQ